MNSTEKIINVSDKALIAELQRRAEQSPEFLRQAQVALTKDEVRPDVKATLVNGGTELKPANIPEFVRKLNLEAQYVERIETLEHYSFLTENGEAKEGDVQPPSFKKAMSTFKLEELEIASHFQKPTLLLLRIRTVTAGI